MKLSNWQKYRMCVIVAMVTIGINLSPLVLARDKTHPELWGTPYTLWMSIVSTCILVGLTYLGSRYLLRELNDDE